LNVGRILLEFLILVEESYFKRIQKLEIQYCRIGLQEAEIISPLLLKAKNLNTLQLKEVEIGNDELEIICKPIMNHPSLSTLMIQYDDQYPAQKTPSNADFLFAEIVRNNHCLSTLGWKVDQRYQVPCCMFNDYNSSTIVNLDISFSFIQDLIPLCQLISTSRVLLSLNISGVLFADPKGPQCIFCAVKNSSVEALTIPSLRVQQSDLESLKAMLTHAKNLNLIFGLPYGIPEKGLKWSLKQYSPLLITQN
jgi:hypothetical protein